MLNEFTSLASFVMNARATLVQKAFVVFTLLLSVSLCSQLTVLVRLNDGQITEEQIEADSEKDIITVEFRQTDGTLVTFLSDFKRVSINPTKCTSTTAANELGNNQRLAPSNPSAALQYNCISVATEQ